MIARQRVFKFPNFKVRGELALGFWWHVSPLVAYKKLMLQGYFLARDYFYICDKFVHGPTEKNGLSVWLLFPICMWWDGCHVSWNCSQEAGWMLGHTLGFSHLNIWFWPAVPHPTMHFPVSSACMASPVSTWDQKFASWDPGSHSTQQI